jgi:molecular chaperone DnaK (HSP70)
LVQKVRDHFGKDLSHRAINPDEAVMHGAALIVGILSGEFEDKPWGVAVSEEAREAGMDDQEEKLLGEYL